MHINLFKMMVEIQFCVHVAFSQCPQLQLLPRVVFALLSNPLLRFHEEGVHPDYQIYLQCLFSALEPASLSRAIYPILTSYATPDKQAYTRHSLSRAALITSGSPIFFLDAFTNLIVYYSSTADPSLPFPPPHDCLLRMTINRLKQRRGASLQSFHSSVEGMMKLHHLRTISLKSRMLMALDLAALQALFLSSRRSPEM